MQKNLKDTIANLRKEISRDVYYCHYKSHNKNLYKVFDIAIDEKTQEPVVIYRQIHPPETESWVRPVYGENGWLTLIEVNGNLIRRFRKATDQELNMIADDDLEGGKNGN